MIHWIQLVFGQTLRSSSVKSSERRAFANKQIPYREGELSRNSRLFNRHDGVGRKSAPPIPLGLSSNPKGRPSGRCVCFGISVGRRPGLGTSNDSLYFRIKTGSGFPTLR